MALKLIEFQEKFMIDTLLLKLTQFDTFGTKLNLLLRWKT